MFTTYVQGKFHTYSYSGSLFITVKLKAK